MLFPHGREGLNIHREAGMVRDYESIFILSTTLDEAEAEKVGLRMREVVAKSGGEVVRVEKWGKRKLAYAIGRHKRGEYVLMQFTGEPRTVAELERNYKMTDSIIKFLTVRLEKEALEHLARLEAAAAAATPPAAETHAEAAGAAEEAASPTPPADETTPPAGA